MKQPRCHIPPSLVRPLSACPVCDYYKIEIAYRWLSREYTQLPSLQQRYAEHLQECPACLDLVHELWPGIKIMPPEVQR